MEKLTIEAAINEISQAYAQLDVAKEECKEVVEAALDAYHGEIENVQSKKHLKEIRAARKTEDKNIKKLAKAMMRGEKDAAQEEADNMTMLIETLG